MTPINPTIRAKMGAKTDDSMRRVFRIILNRVEVYLSYRFIKKVTVPKTIVKRAIHIFFGIGIMV